MQLARPGAIATSPLVQQQVPEPEPASGELVLRLEACAVCRTDLQIVEGDIAARRLPVVPGHQAVGRVEAVGEGVEGWSPGDLAGVGWLGSTCGACEFCVAGRENLCPNARFTGWDRDGGYAERMAVDARFAFALPDGLEPAAAAPLLCGGVIGYRSLLRSGIRPGGALGLFGYGASAHLTLQVARFWDCPILVFTRSSREQERALAAGAEWAGDYDAEARRPLDAAITFAPAGFVVVEALRRVKPGGVVAINAIHLDRMPQFSYDLLWRERELRSVANFTRDDARDFLRLAVDIPVRTAVEVFPLAAANEALKQLASGSLQGTAVLVP